jgi:putative N-acetyltransferase (TIGR04045 family)
LQPAADCDYGRFAHAFHELPLDFTPCEFRVKWADSQWEKERAYSLRRTVFCAEQGLFGQDDYDATDEKAQLLVALACVAGVPEEVVGTVRIAETEPGIWWGSRLAVAHAFRSHGRLGATLIRLAVCSAHATGCEKFFAHVQRQNVPLFRRLRWKSVQEVVLHGREHQLMEADLARYPPCRTPLTGFVTPSLAKGRSAA